jgi:hypothetical protein
MVRLDEVDSYIEDGWLDTPDKWGKEGVEPVDGWVKGDSGPVVEKVAVTADTEPETPIDDCSLEDMTKNELEMYAKEVFGVDLDRRKSKANLIKEIEALENG